MRYSQKLVVALALAACPPIALAAEVNPFPGKKKIAAYSDAAAKTQIGEIDAGVFPLQSIDESDDAIRVKHDSHDYWLRKRDVRVVESKVPDCSTLDPRAAKSVGASRGANEGCAKPVKK